MSMYACTLSFLALIHLINSTCGDLAKNPEKCTVLKTSSKALTSLLDGGFTVQRER